jgi:hypothetical protein
VRLLRSATWAVLLSVIIALVPAVAAGAPPKQLSSDPFSGDGAQHATQVEPDTYGFGSTVVTTFQSGRFFADGGSSAIGWAASQNAGKSWTSSGFLPNLTVATGGAPGRATDPAVAFDVTHDVWLAASETFNAGVPAEYVVSRSTDGGVSFGNPIHAADAPLDKGWIACDNWPSSPFKGRCYLVYLDTATNDIELVRSLDGGLSWNSATPAVISTGGGGGGAQPNILPNGVLVVTFAGPLGMEYARSLDGGASFGSPALIAVNRSHRPNEMRAQPLPSAEVDGSGAIYFAWQDCRFRGNCPFNGEANTNSTNDIVYSVGTNDGTSWSAPQRVPIDDIGSGADHFIPGLAVDPDSFGAGANIAIAYYFFPVGLCAPGTCQLNTGVIYSKDAGTNWSRPKTISSTPMALTSIADTNLGRFVGDYISTSFAGAASIAVTAFSQAPSAPVNGIFNQSIWGAATRVSASP